MEPKYHWVYLWWITPGCLPDTGEKGKAERRRSSSLTYIFRLLIRSIGLHHRKIPSLRLLSHWGNLKSRKIPLTERGDLKRSWIYRTPCPHNKGHTISLYSLNLTISLRNSSFFLYRLQGVKYKRCEICVCFKNNIPKQTLWIRGDISF